MTDNLYLNMLHKLKNMDEKQLVELFHDLESIEAVERIADCAYHFVENYDYEGAQTDISDEQDAKEVDDAERYRDIKSTQESMK